MGAMEKMPLGATATLDCATVVVSPAKKVNKCQSKILIKAALLTRGRASSFKPPNDERQPEPCVDANRVSTALRLLRRRTRGKKREWPHFGRGGAILGTRQYATRPRFLLSRSILASSLRVQRTGQGIGQAQRGAVGKDNFSGWFPSFSL